eukprot:gene31900-40266_t
MFTYLVGLAKYPDWYEAQESVLAVFENDTDTFLMVNDEVDWAECDLGNDTYLPQKIQLVEKHYKWLSGQGRTPDLETMVIRWMVIRRPDLYFATRFDEIMKNMTALKQWKRTESVPSVNSVNKASTEADSTSHTPRTLAECA